MIGTIDRPLRVAIVGAGPSGFYAAGALTEQTTHAVSVDLYDRVPAPFGLVRNGVAPDHEKIKRVARIYRRTAELPNVRFFGNVEYGRDLLLADLRRHYDQIIFAVGTPADRQLGIPGESLAGSDPATDFVGWYNGHPDYRHFDFDLSAEHIAVVGNGNVAMDVARILLRDPETLARTDIADHALARLRTSRVRRVTMLGRRGPAQAAFTNPELREMGELRGTDVIVDPAELELDPASEATLEEDREARRNLETLHELAAREPEGRPRELVMRFLLSPVEILGEHGVVSALRLERNRLEPTESGYLRSVGTGEFETMAVQAVFRAIGYRGVRLPELPFHERWTTIPNELGRIQQTQGGEVLPGLYVVGWAKRGPTGVIGTNKPDAIETVEAMLADLEAGHITPAAEPDPAAVEELVRRRQPALIDYDDWCTIEGLERTRGEQVGRPRVKFCSVDEMLAALEEARQAA